MITYLQIMEQLTVEESTTKLPQRFEIAVVDKADAIEKYNNIFKAFFNGKNFDAHILYHTERVEGADEIEYIEKIRNEGFEELNTTILGNVTVKK